MQELKLLVYILLLLHSGQQRPTPLLLTSAYVHDMVEGFLALHDVHHHLGKAQVVLGEQRVDGEWLDHVVHEEEPLGVLEAALCQVPPVVSLLQSSTLQPGRTDQPQAVSESDISAAKPEVSCSAGGSP